MNLEKRSNRPLLKWRPREWEGIRLCIKELEASFDQFDACECSMETGVDVDMAFHKSIFSASGNPF